VDEAEPIGGVCVSTGYTSRAQGGAGTATAVDRVASVGLGHRIVIYIYIYIYIYQFEILQRHIDIVCKANGHQEDRREHGTKESRYSR
jgi:hypothetical protein